LLISLLNWVLGGSFVTLLVALLGFWLLRELLPVIELPTNSRDSKHRADKAANAKRFAAKQSATSTQRSPGPRAPNQSWDALRRALAGALEMSQLSQIIGRQHARYIGHMMSLFERGDLDAALRHAIPLNTLRELTSNCQPPPLMGWLKPRDNVDINPGAAQASSSVGLGDALAARLVAFYRTAFERLQEQQRWEEAAFVLAELLGSDEEAVAFLEEHGRCQLAAEMAESRDLPPGLIVRQWFVAGNEERAISVARLHGAFADAVWRLEQKADPRGAALRILWARALAEAGQYAPAVEVAWPVEAARAAAREWIELALQTGGLPAARTLARLLQLDTATLEDAAVRQRVLDLLHNEDAEGARARQEFALVLCDGWKSGSNPQRGKAQRSEAKRDASSGAEIPQSEAPHSKVSSIDPVHNKATRWAAREALRALLRDVGGTGAVGTNGAEACSPVQASTLKSLLEFAEDRTLRADFPSLPLDGASATLATRTTPLDISFATRDRGSVPVLDAALLPDGRFLVSLGEAGAHLLSRDGRVVARFDQPCHYIVLSDAGDRALALAPRGRAQTSINAHGQPQYSTIFRLAHLDCVRRRAQHWCEATLQAWADSYDGGHWLVGAQGELALVDVQAPRFGASWKSGDTGGQITTVVRSPADCSLLTVSQPTVDAWNNPLSNAWGNPLQSATARPQTDATPGSAQAAGSAQQPNEGRSSPRNGNAGPFRCNHSLFCGTARGHLLSLTVWSSLCAA
jgi:hypothetical protein